MTEPKSTPCPECKQFNPPEARFCDNCGLALQPGEQARPTAPAPASGHAITTVDASVGVVVAVGQGAKTVNSVSFNSACDFSNVVSLSVFSVCRSFERDFPISNSIQSFRACLQPRFVSESGGIFSYRCLGVFPL